MELKIEPTYKQCLVWNKLFDNHTKFIMFGGGAGGGKSWLICDWLQYMCLKYPGTKWFLGREELKRLMGSTYITFCKVSQFHNLPVGTWDLNAKYNYIQFANGSRIDFLDMKFAPRDPLYERFGSMEFTGGALEEVGEINFTGFDMLKSRIGRHDNQKYNIPSKILLTCNPKKNWAYRLFYKPWRTNKQDKDKCFIQSLYYDNPYTIDQYEENLSSITDRVMRQRLKHGLWEYDDDPSKLFVYDKILDIFTNNADRGVKYCTVDQSGKGRDLAVVTLWEGFFIYKILTFKIGLSNVQLDKILQEEKIPRSRCVIDEDGVGFGLVRDMEGVKGFVNNASAIKEKKTAQDQERVETNYANLKAQCWDLLSTYVNQANPNTPMIGVYREISQKNKDLLIEDLDAMKQINVGKDQPFRVSTKDDIFEDLKRSPDIGDTLMFRMFFELEHKFVFGFA